MHVFQWRCLKHATRVPISTKLIGHGSGTKWKRGNVTTAVVGRSLTTTAVVNMKKKKRNTGGMT